MKKLAGILALALVAFTFAFNSSKKSSSEEGIQFNVKTLKEAMAESKKTGKLIFVDCYTNWCGPCKRMAATSFVDPAVGKVFNKQFINLKMEMEKDAEGPEMARMYRVQAYPTLLVLDKDGKVVKQLVGGQSSQGLLDLAAAVAK